MWMGKAPKSPSPPPPNLPSENLVAAGPQSTAILLKDLAAVGLVAEESAGESATESIEHS